MRKAGFAAAAALSLCLSAHDANASGFQLREQSGTGQGTSYAGMTAGGEDISAMFFNPAALGVQKGGSQVLGLASRIIPKSTFKDGVATRSSGATITGASTHGDAGKDAALPAFYAMWDVGKPYRFGLAVNVPFGLETEYASDWLGRYHATQSAIQTIAVAPTASYTYESLTFGASIVAQRIEAKLGKAVNVNQILGAGSDAFSMLYGSDEGGVGGKFGMIWQPQNSTRLGVSYHTEIRHTLKGDAKFFGAPTALVNNNLLRDTTIQTNVSLPENLSFGVSHDLFSGLTLVGEASWTRWSRVQELRIKFASGRADDVTPLKWRDTMFVAAGAIWKPNDTWAFRMGVAHDQTPVPDADRTPRVPDQDRTWLSLGASFNYGSFGFDLGYSHIFLRQANIQLSDTGATTDPNRFRGNLNGKFDASIDILMGSLRYKF
jgi:long-chain fatty acid transport protein